MISLAGPSTIGKELGMSKQGADWLTRNDPDFPKPFAKEGNRRLWKLADVRRYARRRARREAVEAAEKGAAEREAVADARLEAIRRRASSPA